MFAPGHVACVGFAEHEEPGNSFPVRLHVYSPCHTMRDYQGKSRYVLLHAQIKNNTPEPGYQ